ncbi:unnamed protein product [Parascedosporium putredinis]|uniref:Mediator of RNA polymerase II transcription subunit 7 n=1 Tax=Parascedosporium putredinis TaxID=1442378 RepID=A0A9P1MGQ6_9PEZI|nr:unnamed protein product [Parascedosporium putredinis]CAI8004910.1 unnamed protein product [Parascedosporium putredinis]
MAQSSSFFEDFTEERVDRFKRLLESATGSGNPRDYAFRPPNVPEELINLRPPAEPVDGKWRVFGDQYSLDDKLPGLEEQGIQKLGAEGSSQDEQGKEGKHQDRAFELKRLAKSLLLNFLELLGILSIDPKQAEEKVDDLRTLFINFHHILNEYRPHQARESTIALMQEHLDRTRAETAAIRKPLTEQDELKTGGQTREAEIWGVADELITE